MRIVLSALGIVAAWTLLYWRIDPVPTWFYVFAWYPTLVLLDAIAVRLDRRRSLFADRRLAISVFGWSTVIWFVFEVANFRLENWYYVNLPAFRWERWTGIVVSFATVVPALVLSARILAGTGACEQWTSRPIVVRNADLMTAVTLGVATGALALIEPAVFFPLIWGAAFLIADPFVYRRAPALSLIADLERGEWGRIARLMLGGLGVGLIWECYNYWALGKWVYTVPWLEHTKLFEMPPFGLLGFPVFALEAWSMYAALCVLGVAVPLSGAGRLVRGRVAAIGFAALVLGVVALYGMDRFTVSSTVPRLSALPEIAPQQLAALRRAGVRSPFQLAGLPVDRLARAAALDTATSRQLVDLAQVTTLRGIGTDHAATLHGLGIRSVCDLAGRDDGELFQEIGPETRPTRAEVRVWIRAARRACPDPPLPFLK